MALTARSSIATPLRARTAAPRATRAAAAAPQAAFDKSYPEWGASPYTDPEFKWAAENCPWGPNAGWQTMPQEEKEKWAQRELMHGRWAMMGTAGAWAGEVGTGIPWFQAGKVCTPADCTAVNTIYPGQVVGLAPEGTGFPSFYNVAIFTVVTMGLAEGFRTGLLWNPFPELTVGDMHPGGEHFNPLNIASKGAELDKMKLAELKHARLAMFAWLGYYSQALTTNEGSYNGVSSLPSYTEGAVGPYGNLKQHLFENKTVWDYWP